MPGCGRTLHRWQHTWNAKASYDSSNWRMRSSATSSYTCHGGRMLGSTHLCASACARRGCPVHPRGAGPGRTRPRPPRWPVPRAWQRALAMRWPAQHSSNGWAQASQILLAVASRRLHVRHQAGPGVAPTRMQATSELLLANPPTKFSFMRLRLTCSQDNPAQTASDQTAAQA
jgi:hypothetical protein